MEDNDLNVLSDKRSKVLLVEDIKSDIQLMRMVLDDAYDIAYKLDGESALEYIETHFANLDLIIIDIMLPGMDGYELCRRLKQGARTKDIPIIFITAKRGEKDESKGLELGAVDYITKP
ncbi:MAG: response regulator, partial [Desulfobacterales bacterium]|nr:response regulator [Desulfobacterales bacterium]